MLSPWGHCFLSFFIVTVCSFCIKLSHFSVGGYIASWQFWCFCFSTVLPTVSFLPSCSGMLLWATDFLWIKWCLTRLSVLDIMLQSLACSETSGSQRPPTRCLVYTSSPGPTPTLHSGLTVWFVHRCPRGCGELPEQTDTGACWWELVRDQSPTPTAPEILQFGSLPSKVRGILPTLLARSGYRLGASFHGQDRNTYCYPMFWKPINVSSKF